MVSLYNNLPASMADLTVRTAVELERNQLGTWLDGGVAREGQVKNES